MKLLRVTLGALLLTWGSVAYAGEYSFGFGVPIGQVETSGTETEGTATDTSDRSKTIKEVFYAADLFLEYIDDNGIAYGLSYIPFDFSIGEGSRTDVSTGADVESEADTGSRTAEADLSDFMTLYVNYPMGANGWYGLLGYHMATVETTESLNASSYPNEDITGYQIGFGQRQGTFKYELSYSDFEDINVSSTGGNTNSVSADADAFTFRIAYGF